MKKLWKYRFFILIAIGQTLLWFNITDTWNNNLKFSLWLIGLLISFVAVCLQIVIAPNYVKKTEKV